MFANDLKYCAGDVRLSEKYFEQDILYDEFTGQSFDGWRDHSGLENHLILRTGSISYETRYGIEGVVFDGTAIATMRQYLMMGSGTLLMCLSGGLSVNSAVNPLTIEPYEKTKEKTGNPAYFMQRYVGSGNNRLSWGIPGQTVSATFDGDANGDDTIQRIGMSCDMKSSRGKIYAQVSSNSVVEIARNENASIIPRGSDLIFGRLDQTVNDANRVALSSERQLWLSHVQQWGNFQKGNLLIDNQSDVQSLFSKMT